MFGQVLLLMNFVLFIPSLMVFAESINCSGSRNNYEFQCYSSDHLSVLAFSIASTISASILIIFNNLFVNSQFPNRKIPCSLWDGKPFFVKAIWKITYVFHYDILDAQYREFLKIVVLFIILYCIRLRFALPNIYNKSINSFVMATESIILCLNLFVILQDFIEEPITIELFPIMAIFCFLASGIIIIRQTNNNKKTLSSDNRKVNEFKSENQIILYVSLLFEELLKLKSLEKGQEYATKPQVLTIISRHMESCRAEECICKDYELQFDKKFSSIVSRRLTMRQSTSFSNMDQMFKKKIPSKISYEIKCQIYMAEISDCIDRFLVDYPKSVGLKLLKSFYHHAYTQSSYKGLFVQLQNSHQCNSFRGKINIYHVKTKIQEEMTQSDTSPFSIDITTCLKFEAKRLTFEQTIVDLCLICETFWNELAQEKQDYNIDKVHNLILEISGTIIQIKDVFNQLCTYNPQNIDVIQNYALIYRYILRDEFRFNDIITNLNQLKKTNKLEQTRELTPKFFDSDNYAMLLVSGDVKELGRIVKANRGVENIFGYMPNELQGNKINKIIPRLFSFIHDESIHNFLKRGSSTFIDKNQFLVIENKMRFIQMTLGYIKVMVNLKLGLMFVSFFKNPLKVPSNSEGTNFIKAKDAHFLLCDSQGNIHNMSHNCMKNLGIPPTIIAKSKNIYEQSNMVNIKQFAPNILEQEYDFDLPKGINFIFDTSWFKNDKYLQKEFHELTGRMRKYNIFISLKKYEFKLNQNERQELLLFTVEIISFQLSEAPITIPVDKTDEASYSQYTGTTVSSANSDELRTSKFKEFKTQIQEVRNPSKISILKKITVLFFTLLLGVFTLNYALGATQNSSYTQRVEVLNLLFQLSDKIPSTSRYVRTLVNIANGLEHDTTETIDDRFSYYMDRIRDNSESFRQIQEEVFTEYKSLLQLDDVKVELKDLQTDLTVNNISQTISSALNIFTSKALKFSTNSRESLQGVVIPYISYADEEDLENMPQISELQQDLYFMLQNGHEGIPQGLLQLSQDTDDNLENKSRTFMTITLVIALVSIVLNFSIIPFVYPLMIHYEKIAYYMLHALNKLTKKFIENEVKSCNELFNYIGKKHGTGQVDKKQENMMKKPEARKENKQLMRVNPKIPKIVLEQEKRKNNQRRKSRLKSRKTGRGDEEEEKQPIIKVQKMDDESNDFDEDLDEEQMVFPQKKQSSKRAIGHRYINDGTTSNNDGNTNNMNTGSIGSIDESTVRTSVDQNSSTNKSSGDERSEESSSTSQSNYTQYTHMSQWKAMKQSELGNQVRSNVSMTYDITQAKSSELQGDNKDPHAELSEEEKELKRQVRERRVKIQQKMKKRKCIKVLCLFLLAFLVSIYLVVNTLYTRLVFSFQSHLQEDLRIIDDRVLCYTFSLTLLKEMLSRNQTIVTQFYQDLNENQEDKNRIYLLNCYEQQSDFHDLIMGERQVNGQKVLANQYQRIDESLQTENLCQTVYSSQSSEQEKLYQCETSYNGLMELGLNEVLSNILRQQENSIIYYMSSDKDIQDLMYIFRQTPYTEIESVKDVFIDDILAYQRDDMVKRIQNYASSLFRVFDILFAVFVTICFIIVTFGVFYMISKMQQVIVQIYHIVLLIPYGERTKRELNELLKIRL